MKALGESWDRFWFHPESTSTLAVVRIAFALVILAWTASLAPDLSSFFGPDGMPHDLPPSTSGLDVLRLFQSSWAGVALFVTLLLASVCLLVGFRTRLASVLVFIGVLSLQRHNPLVMNSGDLLLRLVAFYLMLAPAGQSLSVDRWFKHKGDFWRFPKRAPWALRLMQIQLSVIYISTAWAKSAGSTWHDGTAVSYALRIGDLTRFPLPSFVVESLILANLMTYGALAVEIAIGFLVWNRRWRPWVLGAGVGLHLAIEYSLRVGFFGMAMMVLYLAFVPSEVMDRWALALRDRIRRLGTHGVPASLEPVVASARSIREVSPSVASSPGRPLGDEDLQVAGAPAD